MAAGRWYAINNAPHNLPKLEALNEYQTNPLFSGKERAALDFARLQRATKASASSRSTTKKAATTFR